MRRNFFIFAVFLAVMIFGCTAPPKTGAASNNTTLQNATNPYADFVKLSQIGKSAQYRVTYAMNFAQPANGSATFALYRKDANNSMADMKIGATEIRSYMLSGNVFTCVNTNQWLCFNTTSSLSRQVNSMGTLVDQNDVAKNPEKYNVSAKGTMQVADVTAQCYEVVSLAPSSANQPGSTLSIGASDSIICLSAEGVPLYVETAVTINGAAVVGDYTATSYNTRIEDSDLALPAAPQELNANNANELGTAFGQQ